MNDFNFDNVRVYSIGQLSSLLTEAFSNPYFQNIWIEGEIVSKNIKNGHVYLDLSDTDDTSLRKPIIKAIIWKSIAYNLKETYEVGDVIKVKGSLNYYPSNSSVNIIVSYLVKSQNTLGKNLLLKNKLLNKLNVEGYLNREKKKIPKYVDKLAIISSNDAAGYKDILNTLSRRYPVKEKKLFQATVQGASAPLSIKKALNEAYLWNPDVIIIARGGGSKTDLSCFDSEIVAYAVISSPCPIISAIGHTIDTSVLDRLADKVAITPTDAANMINPSLDELYSNLSNLKTTFINSLISTYNSESLYLIKLKDKLIDLMPNKKLSNMESKLNLNKKQLFTLLSQKLLRKEQELKNYKRNFNFSLINAYEAKANKVGQYKNLLESLSINKTLNRGFAIIRKNDKVITSVKMLKIDDRVEIKMRDGEVSSVITSKEND